MVIITKHYHILLILLGACAVLLCASAACIGTQEPASVAETRTITDMMGRTVVIPSEIKSVLCASPPAFTLVYTVAPDRLAGLTIQLGKEYVPEKYAALPVVGLAGTNYETFISMHPDIIVTSNYPGYADEAAARAAVAPMQEKLGSIPVVFIKEGTNITDYSASIRFVGDLLGEDEQAEAMVAFYEEVLATVTDRVASIPDDERVRVYYASDPTGLKTTPAGSCFSLLIELCGGINVVDFGSLPGTSSQEVSMEQILRWDPEVIIVYNPQFYATVRTDPVWQDITAVKTGRVYLVPRTAYSWFTAPPGVNRIIGIPWTAKVLYPDRFQDMDLEGLVREYHELFLHISLSDDQIRDILNP